MKFKISFKKLSIFILLILVVMINLSYSQSTIITFDEARYRAIVGQRLYRGGPNTIIDPVAGLDFYVAYGEMYITRFASGGTYDYMLFFSPLVVQNPTTWDPVGRVVITFDELQKYVRIYAGSDYTPVHDNAYFRIKFYKNISPTNPLYSHNGAGNVDYANTTDGIKMVIVDTKYAENDIFELEFSSLESNPDPPTNLVALDGYDQAVPLAWEAPSGLFSPNKDSNVSLTSDQNDNSIQVRQSYSNDHYLSIWQIESDSIFAQKSTGASLASPASPTGYDIYRSTSSNGSYSKIASNISRTYYRDESLTNGQTYYYKVKAIYSGGESDFSNKVNATPSTTYKITAGWASSSPTINGSIGSSEWSNAATKTITFPGKSGTVKLYAMNNGSKLFLAVDDALNPSLGNNDGIGIFFDLNKNREWPSSGGSNEGLIQLYYQNGSAYARFQGFYGTWPDNIHGDSWQTANGISQDFSLNSGNVQWEGSFDLSTSPIKTSPGNAIGVLFYTIDNGSEFTGAWPQQTAEKLPSIATGYGWAHGPFGYGDLKLKSSGSSTPAAPGNLTATAISSSQINLTWQDNSNNESGFKIQRKTGSSGSWSNIHTTSANTTSYQNTGCSANATYYYRVYAYNSNGNSNYSNTASATTPSTQGFDVSGSTAYYNNNQPISGVILVLGSHSATTNGNGNFSFSDIASGNYTLTPSHNDNLGNSISAYDASMILRYSVGIISFTPYQLIAADVSGNGSVSAYDASYILRYTVGLVNSFPVGDDWKFVPSAFNINNSNWSSAPDYINYTPLNSNQTNQDFKGIVYGDASGNWTLTGLAKSIMGSAEISFGEIQKTTRQQFTVPISAIISGDLLSASFIVHFDHQALKFKEIYLGEKLKDFSMEHSLNQGTIKIALAGIAPIKSSIDLVYLKFELANKNLAATNLELNNAILNEGQISAQFSRREIILNPKLPATHQLQQNYPNPFNPTTTIQYDLPTSSHISLVVYDVLGHRIKTLINAQQPAGHFRADWDGTNESNLPVAAGVYFCRMKTDTFSKAIKLILVR